MGGELFGYEMISAGQPVRPARRVLGALPPGEVRVRVAGCGLCHTDLGFLYDGVRTRQPPPIILGHEIAGIVEAAGEGAEALLGRAVVVPAVIPCGQCRACKAGRSMICPHQVMPGNDRDGGFASHVVVPARGLCVVPGAGEDMDAPLGQAPGLTLRHLAVVADAVSTPYQAVLRAGIGPGDLAIVVGLGGVGSYLVQVARAAGAHVVGLDLNPARLERAAGWGAGLALDPRTLGARELKAAIKAHAREVGAADFGWAIFECSGSAAGQRAAFDLMVHGGTLGVVGYTMDKIELRLSNLMALDARAIGNWGCAPEHYPAIVDLALRGVIDVVSNTELRPLRALPSALEDAHSHGADRRLVLTPEVS